MKAGTKLSLSLIVGLILVPVSAVAAVVVLSPDDGQVLSDAMTPPPFPEAVTPLEPVAQQVIVEPVTASDADLAAACGPDGLQLVQLEKEGTISEVQEAALDALRQLCAEKGLPLPEPPAPPPVVKTVIDRSAGTEQAIDSRSDEHEEHEEHEEDDEHEHDDHEEHEDDD